MHNYIPDPQSGAGNCKQCGAAERHRVHPHQFMRANSAKPNGSQTLCICGKQLADKAHTEVMV
jgi:hypothetical protein